MSSANDIGLMLLLCYFPVSAVISINTLSKQKEFFEKRKISPTIALFITLAIVALQLYLPYVILTNESVYSEYSALTILKQNKWNVLIALFVFSLLFEQQLPPKSSEELRSLSIKLAYLGGLLIKSNSF